MILCFKKTTQDEISKELEKNQYKKEYQNALEKYEINDQWSSQDTQILKKYFEKQYNIRQFILDRYYKRGMKLLTKWQFHLWY